MYDINIKKIKKGKHFYYMFLIGGLFFFIIIGGILISSYIKLKSLDSKVMSNKVIINSYYDSDGEIMYNPTYYYKVNNEEYSCKSDSSSSHYPGENNRIVYYDSKNPSKCMTDYSKSNNKFLYFFELLPLIFIIVAIINIIKINKRIKKINELNQKGKLLKGLPYYMENTRIVINNNPVKRLVVEYPLPNGSSTLLYGDPIYSKNIYDEEVLADIIIDENDLSNYYIDFEINRLTGNLSSDYYNGEINNVELL